MIHRVFRYEPHITCMEYSTNSHLEKRAAWPMRCNCSYIVTVSRDYGAWATITICTPNGNHLSLMAAGRVCLT